MKKSILTLIFLSFAGLLMAHPPKSVNLTYNKEGKITAFYNRVTTGELSFSIETLE